MFEVFQYEFMQRAFVAGLLVSAITPCIGIVVVLKRLSMTGDALSHSSLAGVAAGLAGGFNPVVGAVLFSVLSAFGIERLRKSFPKYSEISIAVVMATGIGLAGIFSGYVKNGSAIMGYLFGSIVLLSDFELFIIAVLSILVISAVLLLYKELFYITFDEESAKLSGVPVGAINFVFTFLTAVTIAVSSRTVGTLVVSSLMVLPVASAMQVAGSYRQTMAVAVGLATSSTAVGLFVSYYLDTKPGATIVLLNVVVLVCVLVYKGFMQRLLLKKNWGRFLKNK